MGTSAHLSAQNSNANFMLMRSQYDNLKAQLMQLASNPDKSLAAENSREPPFEVIIQPSNTSPSQQCDATVCLCNHKGLRPTDSDPPLQDLMTTMPSVRSEWAQLPKQGMASLNRKTQYRLSAIISAITGIMIAMPPDSPKPIASPVWDLMMAAHQGTHT